MADEEIGRLVAVIETDIRGMQKSMADIQKIVDDRFSQVDRRVRQTEATFAQSFNNIAGFASKLGVALSIGGFVSFAKNIVESTAALADQAKTMGVTIEQLQVYRAIMKDAGGTTEQMDTILKRLGSTIGGAKLGSQQSQNILAQLGLGPGDIAGDLSSTIQKIAQALLKIPDAQVRARIETELFSRSGQEFERVLETVAGGVDKVTASLIASGRITPEATALKARDALNELSTAWGKLGTAAAPPLTFMISQLTALVKIAEAAGDVVSAKLPGILDRLEHGAGNTLQDRIQQSQNFGIPQASLTGPQPTWNAALAQQAQQNNAALSGPKFMTDAELAEAKKAAEEIARFFRTLNDEMNAFSKNFDRQFLDTFRKTSEEAIRSANDVGNAIDQLTVARNQANADRLKGTSAEFEAERTASLDATNAQIADIKRLRDEKINALLAADKFNTPGTQKAIEDARAVATAQDEAARVALRARLDDINKAQTAYNDAIAAENDNLVASTASTNAELLRGTQAFYDASRQAAEAATNARINEINRQRDAELAALKSGDIDPTTAANARVQVEELADKKIADARLALSAQLKNIDEDQFHRLQDQITIADGIRTGLENIGVAATHSFGDFKNAAAQALRTVGDLIIQLLVMRPIIDSLLGPKGSAIGGLLGSAGGGLLGGIGHLLGFAAGGSPPVGVPSIVGENGPEIFVPNVSGRIINASQISAAAAGSSNDNSGRVEIALSVSPSGEFDARVQSISGRMIGSAIVSYDRGLPKRVQGINSDPFKTR